CRRPKTAPTTSAQLAGRPGPAKGTAGVNAHKAINEFNAKWAGKEVTDPDQLVEKVAEYKDLKKLAETANAEYASKHAAMQEKLNEAKKQAAVKEKADYEAKEKAAQAQLGLIKNELGISDEQAKGFSALLSMIGAGNIESAISHMKHMQQQASAKGYPQLSGFENALIRHYTGPGSGGVNKALRNGAVTEAQHVFTNMLNKAIDKLPKYTGQAVRKLNLTPESAEKDEPGNIVGQA